MQPLLGRELMVERARAAHTKADRGRMARQAVAARRNGDSKRRLSTAGLVPWRAVARGRAISKSSIRTSSVRQPCIEC